METIFRLTEIQKKALKRLGLFSLRDLLFYFPVRYSDVSKLKLIATLLPGEVATVFGEISKLKTKKGFRSKIPIGEAEIADLSGKIKIIWFHQAYLAKMIREREKVKLTGKVKRGKNGLYLANPEFERTPDLPIDYHDSLFRHSGQGASLTGLSRTPLDNLGFVFPVYREALGITSKWFYHALEKIFRGKILEQLEDYLPAEILKKYNLPALKTALIWIHRPQDKKDAEIARKRFAFEEVFCIQLERQRDKIEYQKNKSFPIRADKKEMADFLRCFPFEMTSAQKKTVETILGDMRKNFPMSRLLEGDVGSGKTAVAATAAHITVKQKIGVDSLQVAYMAPTEILATQHFKSFIQYFNSPTGRLPINIGLITGSGCRKFPSKVASFIARPKDASFGRANWTNISRGQLLKWVANGEIPILIGTHALIQKTVKFKNLALVVIDEQHRFGTAQRRKLVRKDGVAPHLLSMTATPIPRTLALTIYGDLDLSLLDEMPPGRKQIITEIIPPNKRDEVYEKVRAELKAGRQAYVICPRIFEAGEGPFPTSLTESGGGEEARIYGSLGRSNGDGQRKFSAENFRADRNARLGAKQTQLELRSATAEAKRLKKEIFPEYEIAVLHSKMSKQKKEEGMKNFAEGKINILVATSVVEVGVNVPNATTIIIEGAERFGLAQLHQLRGRVLRSTRQAYCYIFADSKTQKTMDRLKALVTAKNGFELSEFDLSLRGAVELGGTKQWGISDLGMEAIKNIKMVEAARNEAVRLISEDLTLSKYPLLKTRVGEKTREFHFE